MPSGLGHRSRWLLAAALHAALLLTLTSPLLLGWREPIWDARDMGVPFYSYFSRSLWEGRFPLWDPYTNCGYPFFADPGFPVLNPIVLSIAFTVQSATLGFVTYWIAHWLIGGLGMMALVAALGGGPAGAFAAAGLYAFSGFFLGHGEHTGFIVTAGWLPWAFAFAHAAVAGRRRSLALASGLALGLSANGGYAAIVAFSGAFLAIWLALEFLPPSGPGSDGGRPMRSRLGWVAGVLATSAILLAITFAPILYAFLREGAAYTTRTGALPPEVALSDNPFTLRAWLSLAFPGLTVLRPEWFGTDVSMSNGYAGFLAVPLAATWLARAPRRHLGLLAVGLLALTAAAGSQLPVREALYWLMPVTQYLRHNATFRLLWILPLVAAAGCGVSWLADHPEDRRTFGLALAAWAVACAVTGTWVATGWSPLVPFDAYALPAFGPAVVMLVAGALVALSASRLAAVRTLAPLLAALCAGDAALHVATNAGATWTAPGVLLAIEQWPRQDAPAAPRVLGAPTGFLNAHLMVGVPAVEGYVTMVSDFNRVLVRSPFAQVLSTTRFWVAPGTTRAANDEGSVRLLASVPPGAPVPVLVSDEAGPDGPPVQPGSYGSARIIRYQPELVEIEVEVPGEEGFLASTERFASGWRVFVDGKQAPVVRTNVYFRGVALPGGRHRVEWRFDPGAFWWLVAAAALTALGASAAAVLLWRRERRARPA